MSQRSPLAAGHVRLYRAIFAHGPATVSELLARAGSEGDFIARLRELLARGLVGEVGQRRCAVTRRRAIAWDVVGGLRRGIDLKDDSLETGRHADEPCSPECVRSRPEYLHDWSGGCSRARA
jgi:hypothetical protein